MPAIVDRYAVGQVHDKRRKLTEEQKEEIRGKYSTGFYSYCMLANEYKVSKRTVNNIINPVTAQKSKNRIKDHWKDYQQHGKEWAETMQKHRQYKKKLLEAGEKLPNIRKEQLLHSGLKKVML